MGNSASSSSASAEERAMARSSALRETLKLPPGISLEAISDGPIMGDDYFYNCIEKLLCRQYEKSGYMTLRWGDARPPLLSAHVGHQSVYQPGLISMTPSAQFLRIYVANNLSYEQLNLYKMHADAGLEKYAFAKDLTLDQIREFAKKRSGSKRLWADEFAMRKISDGLLLTLLIVDDEAARGSGGAGRKRGRDDDSSSVANDNRFVVIGSYPHALILHRIRRQWYDAVVIDGRPVIELRRLPACVRSNWALDKLSDCGDPGEETDKPKRQSKCKAPAEHDEVSQNIKSFDGFERKDGVSTSGAAKPSSPVGLGKDATARG